MGENLKQRVADRANGGNGGNGAELEQRDQGRLLADEIRRMKPEFAVAMPTGGEAAQIVRDALTELRRTPKLGQCDSTSVMGALMTCAQLNLRVGVLGQAWPVPFWDKRARRFKAQLIIGYQGYRELAWRSGFLASNAAREVKEGDYFDWKYGLDERLDHRPAEDDSEERAVTHYYAVVRYVNGGHDFEVMSQSAVNRHRDRFASSRDRNGVIFGPWIDHPISMGRKTPYLVVIKRSPKTPAMERAIAADGTVRLDLTPDDPDVAVHGEHPAIDGELVPDEQAGQERSGPITEPQSNQLRSLLGAAQLGEKTERDLLTKLVGRQVTALVNLTAAEADSVITRIAELSAQAEKAGIPLAEHVAELLDRPAGGTDSSGGAR